jgi:hypothetical protein
MFHVKQVWIFDFSDYMFHVKQSDDRYFYFRNVSRGTLKICFIKNAYTRLFKNNQNYSKITLLTSIKKETLARLLNNRLRINQKLE